MFKRNEGILDRLVRAVIGVVFTPIGLFVLGGLQGKVAGIVFIVIGGIGLFTAITGFCLPYALLGISTLDMENRVIARFKSMAAECRSNAGFRGGRMCWPGSSSVEKINPAEPQSTSN